MFFDVLNDEIIDKIQKNLPLVVVDLINQIGTTAKNIWKTEAVAASSWGDKYAQAIDMKPATPNGNALVYLNSETIDQKSGKPALMFAMMVENGVEPWSIKNALLESDKVRTTIHGIKYIIVPFPWRTPAKKGQGRPAAKFGGRIMPNDIYKIIKGGGRLESDSEKYGHMAGMVKYSKNNHSQYMTFRMVTENSKGWQHPGKPATPVFERVAAQVERMIEETLNNFLKAYASGNSN